MRRLGLRDIDFYVSRRQLGWVGHVSPMDFERLPRRMLSCWVPPYMRNTYSTYLLWS